MERPAPVADLELELRPGELPAYTQHLDVGLLPYRVNAYTNCIYPLKLHEYNAAGIPAVGSRIRTLLEYDGVVSLATRVDEWSAAIEAALGPESCKPEAVAARRAVAKDHDWNQIAQRIAATIEDGLARPADRS